MTITKTAVWQKWDNTGLEYLNFEEEENSFFAKSTIISVENNIPFLLEYTLRLDKHFQVERVVIGLSEQSSTLLSHRSGQWFDPLKHPIPELDGCYDICVPEMTMERVTQQYTCLEKHDQGSKFEFRQGDFSAILPIDVDGFVQNYPNLFRRLV
jgi:hypothetical protein